MTLLTSARAQSAARYNIRTARRTGWQSEWSGVAHALNVDQTVAAEDFAETVAHWQKQTHVLTIDGKLGPATWRQMRNRAGQAFQSIQAPAWLPITRAASPVRPVSDAPAEGAATPDEGAAPGGAPWMAIADREMRTNWRSGGARINENDTEHNEGYFAATPYWGGSTHTLGEGPGIRNRDWCAAFVNYCLHRAGYSHTGSAGAASFGNRGLWRFEALASPRRGCITLVGTESVAHVTFLDRWDNLPDAPDGNVSNWAGRGVYVLGGNQSASPTVCSKHETRSTLFAFRGHGGVLSPYLWPHQGSATCNSDVPTARPHFCGRPWH